MRILLPVQGTQVPPLVWEDTTGLGAAKPRATITDPRLQPLLPARSRRSEKRMLRSEAASSPIAARESTGAQHRPSTTQSKISVPYSTQSRESLHC